MLKVREGYRKDATVLAVVADRDEARQWAKDNGYGPLGVQLRKDEFRVALLFDPIRDLDV